MADDKTKQARKMFDTLCGALDADDLVYRKNEEEMSVSLSFAGDEFPVEIEVTADAERECIRLISPLPFAFRESRRREGALVTGFANYSLREGCFDYLYERGGVYFRMTESYRDSLLSGVSFAFMVSLAVSTVQKYCERFLLVSLGKMSVEEFCTEE